MNKLFLVLGFLVMNGNGFAAEALRLDAACKMTCVSESRLEKSMDEDSPVGHYVDVRSTIYVDYKNLSRKEIETEFQSECKKRFPNPGLMVSGDCEYFKH